MTLRSQNFSSQLGQSRILELKQIYLEKQIQIESLEREREATLLLLTEAQSLQNVKKPKVSIQREEKRRKQERKLFSNPSKEQRGLNSQRVYTEPQKCDDFKEYIDREYLQLKLDLDNIRNHNYKDPEDLNNVASLSNLSEISTKNHNNRSDFQSFSSNFLRSPQNPEDSSFKPSFKYFGSVKESKKERPQNWLKSKNLTIESNNIEIKPVKRKKSDLGIEVKVRNEIAEAKRTSHSASNKKLKKEKGVFESQFLPYAVPYYVYPYPYPDYIRMSYQNNLNENEILTESHANYKPFLFKDISESEQEEAPLNPKNHLYKKPKNLEKNKASPIHSDQEINESPKNSNKIFYENQAINTHLNLNKQSSDSHDLSRTEFNSLTEEVTFANQSDSQTSEELEKKPVLINVGETENKPLSQIFNERKKKTAERIQNREEQLQRSPHRLKTKNELINIRKNLLKTPTARSKSPKKRDKSSELTERLLSGQRVKLSKEEIQKINRKFYEIPEAKKRKEGLKRQEKQSRVQKARDYEEVALNQKTKSQKRQFK